jgi:hypothetical protein
VEPVTGELSVLDRQYMLQQRARLDELARNHLGRGFSGERERDLDSLQRLLDRRLVGPDQTGELQAMGIVLGDLLAAELDLHWVVYEDEIGRTRALQDRRSGNYLFPVTMISRRVEVGNSESVRAIYDRARDTVKAHRNALPAYR